MKIIQFALAIILINLISFHDCMKPESRQIFFFAHVTMSIVETWNRLKSICKMRIRLKVVALWT